MPHVDSLVFRRQCTGFEMLRESAGSRNDVGESIALPRRSLLFTGPKMPQVDLLAPFVLRQIVI